MFVESKKIGLNEIPIRPSIRREGAAPGSAQERCEEMEGELGVRARL